MCTEYTKKTENIKVVPTLIFIICHENLLTTYQSTTKYLVNRVTDMSIQVHKLMEKNAGK